MMDWVWFTLGMLVIIVIAAAFPFGVIWALNTLFGLGIPFGFAEWCAVVVLGLYIRSSHSAGSK